MDRVRVRDADFSFRYDGLDAEKHEIELNSLGESLKGFSKVLATAGTFAVTQKYTKNSTRQEVKIYAKEAKANCFTIHAAMDFITQSQLFSGSAAAILGALIPYIFAKNAQKKEEMRYLKDALETAIEALGNKDKSTIEGLISVIDKMATELRPSASSSDNPYLASLAKFLTHGINERSSVKITAKASVRKGNISKLFIVDIEV